MSLSFTIGGEALVASAAGIALTGGGGGGVLVVAGGAGGAGSDFGEQAAKSTMPAKGAISMKRRRDVKLFMVIPCGGSDTLAWVCKWTASVNRF